MGSTLRVLWLILIELWPLLVLATAIAVAAWYRARPLLASHAGWLARRHELEAEVVRLSHAAGEVERLVAAQGELAAHDVLEPPLPRWIFWARRR